jgi:hypothetical protein
MLFFSKNKFKVRYNQKIKLVFFIFINLWHFDYPESVFSFKKSFFCFSGDISVGTIFKPFCLLNLTNKRQTWLENGPTPTEISPKKFF